MAEMRNIPHIFEQLKVHHPLRSNIFITVELLDQNNLCCQKHKYFYLRDEVICLPMPVLLRASTTFFQQLMHNLTNCTECMQRESGTILSLGSNLGKVDLQGQFATCEAFKSHESTIPQSQRMECRPKYPEELKNSHVTSGIGPNAVISVGRKGKQGEMLPHVSLEQAQYSNCTGISSNQQDLQLFVMTTTPTRGLLCITVSVCSTLRVFSISQKKPSSF